MYLRPNSEKMQKKKKKLLINFEFTHLKKKYQYFFL